MSNISVVQGELLVQIAEAKLHFWDTAFVHASIPRLVDVARDTAKFVMGNDEAAKFVMGNDEDVASAATMTAHRLVAKYGPPSLIEEIAKYALKKEAGQ